MDYKNKITSMMSGEFDDARKREMLFTMTMTMSQQILPSLLGFSEIKGDKGPESEFDIFEEEQEDNNIDECVEKAFEASYKYAKKMVELQEDLFEEKS